MRNKNGYKIMEKEELKKQMMELWKENFHDSDEYIKLVFDRYFDPEYVEYEEREGRIIASLLAVPYTFGNDDYSIKGVYLCGLSTYLKHRGEGIMTDLLRRIEVRMAEKGYAFMFLIPANEGLNRYYNDRGFINGFYRSRLHYTSIHDFKKDYFSTLMKEERALSEVKRGYYNCLDVEIIDRREALFEGDVLTEIIDFILACECRQQGLSIYQNYDQLKTALEEALISGGELAICRNREGEVAGIGLYSRSENEIKEYGRYAINYGALCKLREVVTLTGDDRNLTVIQYGYEKTSNNKSLWNPMFSTILPGTTQVGAVGMIERVYDPNSHSEIYGMVRILSISEILKFLSNWRRDLKYSILVRWEKSGKISEFVAKDGQVEEKEVTLDNSDHDSEHTSYKNKKIVHIRDSHGYERIVLSERDLGEILFRRPGGDRLIEEAFGLPALNGRISLLLD